MLGTLLPSIFLAVAAFLLHVVAARLVSTQREQIAALKALGYGNRSIAAHYLKLVTPMVGGGYLLGLLLGDWLGGLLTGLYAEFFHFPSFSHRVAPSLVLTSLAIVTMTALLGTLTAIAATVRLAPAEAMRPLAPGRYRRALLERLPHLRTGPALRMILRNIERRPLRSALTTGGIAAAVAIVVMGNFFRDAIEVIVDASFTLAMRGDIAVWTTDPVDASAARALARIPGVLQVEPGRSVAVLTPLMSPMVDERSRREAKARLKAATAGVERATARMQRAEVSLQEAWLELQRAGQLAGEGFVSPARLDTTRLAVTAARRELDIANAEREVARQEQAQASAALMPATANAKDARPFALPSPVNGVVLRVALPSEATIAAGTALLDVGDPARMEVVCELLTADAVQAQPGHRVVIERWGGPPIEGRVRRVEPAAFTKVSALGIEEQRVNVLIDIADPTKAWQAMGDGFRVGVRIVTDSIEQAVQVPVGALFPHGEGMAAYRLDGRRVRLQAVDVAARNATTAWLREGLVPSQVVVVYPPASLADGQNVRVRTP